ncbi:MAG TPA: ABC transporter ATP-binding protein [Reyranella sp.]|nr:ABC transporter ATP-binding protein [Reyranella sp.]
MSGTLLATQGLAHRFRLKDGRAVRAVDGVDLAVGAGEILGIVGESGCGKSTLGKTLIGVLRADDGTVTFEGAAIQNLAGPALRAVRARLQYVYQDAGAALDPRWTIGRSLDEALVIHTTLSRAERVARVRETLASVGLHEDQLALYPHEISGGQQRRVGLARVLALHPRVLILDEPTSGLDVSVQATILKLLVALWKQYGLTLLFISHDLAVVRSVCTRVAVMYLGRIVETGPTAALFADPRHPYTKSLLAAVPLPGGRRVIEQAWLEGEPPDPLDIPSGCRFRNRCPMAQPLCATDDPALRPLAPGHDAACHFA